MGGDGRCRAEVDGHFFFHIGETCLDLLFMDLMPFEKDLFVQYTNTQTSIQTYPDGMLRMATWTRNHV